MYLEFAGKERISVAPQPRRAVQSLWQILRANQFIVYQCLSDLWPSHFQVPKYEGVFGIVWLALVVFQHHHYYSTLFFFANLSIIPGIHKRTHTNARTHTHTKLLNCLRTEQNADIAIQS